MSKLSQKTAKTVVVVAANCKKKAMLWQFQQFLKLTVTVLKVQQFGEYESSDCFYSYCDSFRSFKSIVV